MSLTLFLKLCVHTEWVIQHYMPQRRRFFELLTSKSHQYKMLTNVTQSHVFSWRSYVTVCTSQKTVKNNRLNLCQSFPSLTILVSLWFIIISLVFFYLCKLLFSGFLHFQGNFEYGKNKSRYCERETTTQEKKYLKGHCHTIWQLYKKLEGAFTSL